ncbi:MAG: lipopolysaccharide heptosyltransferase I [Gammaproteobacteria bacterium]|nr:MAG: lipopolysaccharide heptosyltransferase I [Gammaproteobacteria bacterium]RLA53292.1 MAG: lipopolysaccharide heptosyltransferase I [Gammaproteobacteria bacterium]
MRVLIVKLTSMGDLVQALPALTDARRAIPDIEFDWVVDESFAEVASWHPAVVRTLHTAHRRWRAEWLTLWRNTELRRFVRQLRSIHYDAVIDAQTNFKSAIVTALSKGKKYGPNGASVSEWGAHLAYNKRYVVPKNQLAIDRWRQLFAQVLDYPLPNGVPDFGLATTSWPKPDIELPQCQYLVFVQNASWPNKRWLDDYWRQLIEKAGQQGYAVLLPWGSESERVQAVALAGAYEYATVLPRLSLTKLAAVLKGSVGTLCVDTGLAHVSAALDVPTVTLYGATDPHLIGATGSKTAHLEVEGYPCAPCYKKYCAVGSYKGDDAQCMKTLDADKVWSSLMATMGNRMINLVD